MTDAPEVLEDNGFEENIIEGTLFKLTSYCLRHSDAY